MEYLAKQAKHTTNWILETSPRNIVKRQDLNESRARARCKTSQDAATGLLVKAKHTLSVDLDLSLASKRLSKERENITSKQSPEKHTTLFQVSLKKFYNKLPQPKTAVEQSRASMLPKTHTTSQLAAAQLDANNMNSDLL